MLEVVVLFRSAELAQFLGGEISDFPSVSWPEAMPRDKAR
jgi:hypothetical protein